MPWCGARWLLVWRWWEFFETMQWKTLLDVHNAMFTYYCCEKCVLQFSDHEKVFTLLPLSLVCLPLGSQRRKQREQWKSDPTSTFPVWVSHFAVADTKQRDCTPCLLTLISAMVWLFQNFLLLKYHVKFCLSGWKR